MKNILFVLVLTLCPFLSAQTYIRDQKSGDGYFSLNLGSFSVAPNMGGGIAFGFGSQFFRDGNIGVGLDFLSAAYKPSALLDGASRLINLFLKYYLSENINLSLLGGTASQVQFNSSGSQSGSYGFYGVSIGYDYHQAHDLFGYGIDLQAMNVANSPAQSWLGAKASVKLWFE